MSFRRILATVERDGRWLEMPLRVVVPGDLIRLSAGDLVPVDARLLEARDLSVQQAMLAGESLPVDKQAGEPDAASTGPEDPAFVFLGTSVVSGTGIAVAFATGPRTVFGDIAKRLGTRAPESEFEHGLRPVQSVDPPHHDCSRALHPAGGAGAAARPDRIAAVRRGARRWPHAGVSAHDRLGHPHSGRDSHGP